MKNFITNKQISFILYCIIIGYGVVNLPKDAAETGRTGGWVSILIAGIVFISITYMLTYLQYKHEDKTIYEYSEVLLGKFVTNIIIVIYTVHFFLWFTLMIRIYCENLHLTVLLNTPAKYMSILFYIVADYIIIKGLKSIASLCEIYGLINIIFIMIFILIFFGEGDSVNIMPIFLKEDIPKYLSSIPHMLTPFIGAEIILLIPISKSNNKNIFKYTTITTGVITIIYILITESAISVVGVDPIINMKTSVFSIAKGLDVEYLELLRRVDGAFFFILTLNVVGAVSLLGHGTCILLSKILKKIKYSFIVICVSIISFILGKIPKSLQSADLIAKYLSYGDIMIYFVVPIILIIFTRVKRYDKEV